MYAAEVIRDRVAINMAGNRVLVAAHTGFVAHSGRARHIADALGAFGATVIRAGDISQPHARILCGADVDLMWSGPLLDRKLIMEFAQNRVSWGFYDRQTLMAHVVAWRTLIERGIISVVVGDFALPAIIAADSLGIPTVSVQNILWTSVFRLRLTPPEHYWIQRSFASAGLTWLSRFLCRHIPVVNLLYGESQRVWAQPYNAVRRELGLTTRSTYLAHTEGQLVLIPELKAVCNRYGRLGEAKYVAVGPIVWEPEVSLADASYKIQRFIDSGQSFVYASFGSSGTQQLFQLLLDAFRRRHDGLNLVLTTGGQFKEWECWKNLPTSVVAAPFYPGGSAIAAPGCVAAINHGGSGSVYQAQLAAPRIPQIMIPTHAEQQWNAEMMQGLGFGTVLFLDDLTPERLNREIDRLVSKSRKEPDQIS